MSYDNMKQMKEILMRRNYYTPIRKIKPEISNLSGQCSLPHPQSKYYGLVELLAQLNGCSTSERDG